MTGPSLIDMERVADQQLEDHPVRDPGPVTAQRVLVAALRQQCGELFPDGLNQA